MDEPAANADPELPGAAPRAPAPPAKRKWGCLGSPWALGCFGLLGMFVVALGLIWVVNGRDIEPPDVSDVTVVLESVPPGDNALSYLMNGRGQIAPAEAEGRVDDSKFGVWSDIAQGRSDADGAWDAAAVEALVAANTGALEDLQAAAAAPHCTVTALDFNAPIPGLLDMKRLCQLAQLRAEQRRRAGDHAGALEAVLPAVRLGNRLQTGTGTLIINMIGVAIEGMALGSVRRIVADPGCPAEVCEQAAAAVRALAPRGPGLATAFRSEFTTAANYLDSVTQPGQLNAVGPSFPAWLDRGPGFFFHPNRTKQLMAADYRILVRNAEVPPPQAAPAPEPPVFDGFWGKVRLIGGGNAVGNMMRAIVTPGLARVSDARASADAQARCTAAYAAAVAHLRRTGSRPAGLADVLREVPADPYDGRPLRYDPATGVIWSVGKNGTDEGGDCDSAERIGELDCHWPHQAADPGLRLPPK